MLDQTKKREIDATKDIDITQSFVREKNTEPTNLSQAKKDKTDYGFINKSKKTLLIFRRMSNPKSKCTLELRHQRTCDVVFDWAISDERYVKDAKAKLDPINSDGIERNNQFKPSNYIYKMIETMLPKAMYDSCSRLRLLELWATDLSPRKGWVKIAVQQGS